MAAEADLYPTTEEGWDHLRAHFDEVGQRSLEELAGEMPAEIAGPRIARLNDMLIAQLRERVRKLGSGLCRCGHPQEAHGDFGFLCNRFPCGCSFFEREGAG